SSIRRSLKTQTANLALGDDVGRAALPAVPGRDRGLARWGLRAEASARRRHLVGQPVEAQVGQLGPRRIAGRGIEAGALAVGRPPVLDPAGREAPAGRRTLAAGRLEELLRQHVLRLADALARVERAEEVDSALAGLDQLVDRGVPACAVAHQLDRVGRSVELP